MTDKEITFVDAKGNDIPKPEPYRRPMTIQERREQEREMFGEHDRYFMWWFIGAVLFLMLITGEFNA